jgi:NADH-quinone oxidoreductase subunit K
MNDPILTYIGLGGGAPVGLYAYLVVAALLFVFGLIACMARRNAIGILIGIELILNAAILNFMAFWRFGGGVTEGPGAMAGPMFGVFIIILAACEAAVALAVLLNLYFNFGTVEVDSIHKLNR